MRRLGPLPGSHADPVVPGIGQYVGPRAALCQPLKVEDKPLYEWSTPDRLFHLVISPHRSSTYRVPSPLFTPPHSQPDTTSQSNTSPKSTSYWEPISLNPGYSPPPQPVCDIGLGHSVLRVQPAGSSHGPRPTSTPAPSLHPPLPRRPRMRTNHTSLHRLRDIRLSQYSKMDRSELMQRTAAIIGVPLSSVIELAEGSPEPHVSGWAAPPQSEPGPVWTPDQFVTLENTAHAMGIPVSRLFRFAEARAARDAQRSLSTATEGTALMYGEYSIFHEGLAQAEGPWIQVGRPHDVESIGSGSSSGHYARLQFQNQARHLGEQNSWLQLSRFNGQQNEPWNAFGPAQHSPWISSSESGTGREPHFTPQHSSHGSPAGLTEHLGTSITPDVRASPINDYDFITRGAGVGAGQSLDIPSVRNAAVQTDTRDIQAVHIKQDDECPSSVHTEASTSVTSRKRSHDSLESGQDLHEKRKKSQQVTEKSRQFSHKGCLQCSMKKKGVGPSFS